MHKKRTGSVSSLPLVNTLGHFQLKSSNFELEFTNGKVALNVSGAIEIIKSGGPIFFSSFFLIVSQ